MKDAGIGGFEVQPVYPLTLDDPSKGLINLRYLSPEFLAAVSSTARTAHELGLRMDMTMGSGWPFGGPHITPELAAEGLRCLRIPIQHRRPDDPGSAVADRPAIPCGVCGFRETGSTSTRVPRIKSTRGRMEAFSFPHLPLFLASLLFFVAGLTGQQVKRAAVGAEGNVLDHYSRAAMQKHMEAVGAPLAAAGGGNIRAMFCDSLEVYDSNWTVGFLKEFQSAAWIRLDALPSRAHCRQRTADGGRAA